MLLRGNNSAFARQYLWCCRLLVFGCRLLVFGCRLLVFGCRYWLPAKATDNLQPTTDNLQPITYNLQPTTYYLLIFYSSTIRPQVLSGRQYLAGVCSSHFLYVLVLSSRQLLPSCP